MKKAYKIKDVNGKEFTFDLTDIMDMTTSPQLPLEDGESHVEHTPRIVDYLGQAFDMSAMTDSANNGDPIVAVDATFEATHSGRNLNYANYHSDSMEKDAVTFMVPFKKPLIKNHDVYEEPLGRVINSVFKPSALNESRDCIEVTWRVTDVDAIPKLLDSRYSTLSIGASANHVKCEVCGNDIVKDGQFKKFCGHWRGETYNGAVAYWTSRDMVYKEGSIVNTPADHWAQLVELKAYTQSQLNDLMDSSKGQATAQGDDQENQADTDKATDSDETLNIIDSLLPVEMLKTDAETSLANSDNSDTDENQENGDDGSDESGESDGDAGNEENNEEGEEEEDGSDNGDAESVNARLIELQTQLDALTAEKLGLEAELVKAKGDLETSTATIVELEAAKKNSDEQVTLFKNQAVRLAIKVKDEMIQKVISAMIDSKVITAEQTDETEIVLKSNTTKELEDKLKQHATASTTAVPPVANPGVVNNIGDNVIDGTEEEDVDSKEKTKANERSKTIKDLEDKLSHKLGLN